MACIRVYFNYGVLGNEHDSTGRSFAEPQLSWPMWCTAAKRYAKTMQFLCVLLVPGSLSQCATRVLVPETLDCDHWS